MSRERVAAVDGWFTLDDDNPKLIGSRCTTCGTVAFPPGRATFCPDPTCSGARFASVPLSSRGTVWSYTDARYAPPPPFIPPTDPYQPYAIAAVELTDERIVVLGQVATGVGAADLSVGTPVELTLDTLYSDDERDYLIWKWRPVS